MSRRGLLAGVAGVLAAWLGRRWAARLTSALRRDLAAVVEESAFTGIERLEEARAALAAAWERAEADRRAGSSQRGRLADLGSRLAARLPGREPRTG